MGAIDGLSFHSRIPPRVENEDIICGGKIQAYDPEAMSACAAIYGHRDDMIYADVKEDALNNADCLVICTEWKMFW